MSEPASLASSGEGPARGQAARSPEEGRHLGRRRGYPALSEGAGRRRARDIIVEDLVKQLLGGGLCREDVYPAAEVGERLERFTLVAELGRGGMSVVYRVRDEELDREAALKLLDTGAWTLRDEERFRREGRALARLEHPGVVRLYEVGALGSRPFLVMEWVEGCDLAEALARGQLERRAIVRACAEVSEALAHVHERGLIHRDVKPSNVLLDRRSGAARLTDFGLALEREGGERLTRTDAFVGTPAYMAPEQAEGEASAAVDVYALGVLLFEALSGRLPFEEDSVICLIRRLALEEPPSLCELAPDLDPRLSALVSECLHKRPARRPPAAEVARRLRQILDRPAAARRAPLGVGLRQVLAVSAMSALFGAALLSLNLLERQLGPPRQFTAAPSREAAEGLSPEAAEGLSPEAAAGLSGEVGSLGWGVGRTDLVGLRLVEEVGLEDRGGVPVLARRGLSRITASFDLARAPAWGQIVLTGRALPSGGRRDARLVVEVNGLVVLAGVSPPGRWLEVAVPAAALRRGRNSLSLRLHEQAKTKYSFESLQLLYGRGEAPRSSVGLLWDCRAQVEDDRARLEVSEERRVRRANTRWVLEEPGESQLSFSLSARYRPAWLQLQAKVLARRPLDLLINGEVAVRGWRGRVLELPGELLREGANRLSLRAAGAPVMVRWLSVTYGETPAPPAGEGRAHWGQRAP